MADMPAPPPLKLTRTIPFPRDRVFAAWLSARSVQAWFTPLPFSAPEATVEPQPGGRFEVMFRPPLGPAFWTRGSFVEIEPDRRLLLDLYAENPDGSRAFGALTEIVFSDAPEGGTTLDVTQTYSPMPGTGPEMFAGADIGWNMTIDQMQRYLRSAG